MLDGIRRRVRSTPARDFLSLAAQSERGSEGKQRGAQGLYRGGLGATVGALIRAESTREDRGGSGLFFLHRRLRTNDVIADVTVGPACQWEKEREVGWAAHLGSCWVLRCARAVGKGGLWPRAAVFFFCSDSFPFSFFFLFFFNSKLST